MVKNYYFNIMWKEQKTIQSKTEYSSFLTHENENVQSVQSEMLIDSIDDGMVQKILLLAIEINRKDIIIQEISTREASTLEELKKLSQHQKHTIEENSQLLQKISVLEIRLEKFSKESDGGKELDGK